MPKDQTTALKCGYINKQSKIMSVWKERYLKLCSNSTLEYYHYKTDTQIRCVIDLSLVTNMRKKSATQFIIDTPSRSWKFKVNNVSGTDAWFQQIFAIWNIKKCIDNNNMQYQEHLLTLLNTPDPGVYLHFIYTKLQILTHERDAVIFKFEMCIQNKCCNLEHLLIHNDNVILQILEICKMEDEATKENKILKYCYQDWMEWNQYTSDIMKDMLWLCIQHCGIMKTREIDEKQEITQWVKDVNDNMNDVDDMAHNVDIVFPENYNIIHYYMICYYKEIISIVVRKLNDTNIATHNILCMISWIEEFKLKLETLNTKYTMKNEDIIEYLSEKQMFLMKLYTNVARNKLSIWVHNIVENERKKQEFFIIKHIPRVHCVQDVFIALEHQFHHVLTGEMWMDIAMLILTTLNEFEIALKQYIDSYHTEFGDQYLCALINSIYDVSLKLTNYQYGMNDKQYMILSDHFDEIISKFTILTKQCAMKLAEKVCVDVLQQNVFEVLFSLQYFVDESGSELIDCMILTIIDYLEDFNVWIEEKHFVTVFCKSLVTIISNEYIKALLRNKPRTSKLMECIRNDVIKMNEYFGDTELFTDSQFNRIWQSIHEYLNAIHFALEIEDELFDSFAQVLKSDEVYGEKVLQYILKKRKIQYMDHVFGNKMYLRKFKHNKVTRKMSMYLQKTKQKKHHTTKQQNKAKKRSRTFTF